MNICVQSFVEHVFISLGYVPMRGIGNRITLTGNMAALCLILGGTEKPIKFYLASSFSTSPPILPVPSSWLQLC
jgi:hypothetical protein